MSDRQRPKWLRFGRRRGPSEQIPVAEPPPTDRAWLETESATVRGKPVPVLTGTLTGEPVRRDARLRRRRLEFGERLRGFLAAGREAAVARTRTAQLERTARPRGVDRVPERLRVKVPEATTVAWNETVRNPHLTPEQRRTATRQARAAARERLRAARTGDLR